MKKIWTISVILKESLIYNSMEDNKQLDLFQGRNEQKVKNNYKVMEWVYLLLLLSLVAVIISEVL